MLGVAELRITKSSRSTDGCFLRCFSESSLGCATDLGRESGSCSVFLNLTERTVVPDATGQLAHTAEIVSRTVQLI